MKIAVTGATGLVGYPVAQYLIRRGHDLTTLGRQELPGVDHMDWALEEVPDLSGIDAVVHAAFSHLPGLYRGGEGKDPEGFIERNLEGTLGLWDAMRRAGGRAVFLSSRAVYGAYPPGTELTEDLQPRPNTLYGNVKLEAERALGHGGVSLRITGVFGPPVPGRAHKWTELFAQHAAGLPVAPGIGTEVHVDDVARAVEIALNPDLRGKVLNVSDFILDRRTLLTAYNAATGCEHPVPEASDPSRVSAMSTSRLWDLGWTPAGPETLPDVVEVLAN